jgi:hypothetical protein
MSKLNKYTLFVVLISILVYSCKENIITDVIKIDISQAKPGILSEIVDSISCIQLETTDECLIASIGLIKYHDRHYYIYDIPAKTIYVFNETGKYVNKLCKYGQGPGEYLVINSFTVDNDKRIHILDLGLKQILIYDKSGDFLSRVNIDENDYPRDLFCLGDKYLLYMPDENIEARQGAYIFDTEKHTYTQILSFNEDDKKTFLTLPTYLVEKTNFNYSLINTCSNIIYNMKINEIINRFQFDIKPRYNPQSRTGYLLSGCIETDSIINMYWGHCVNNYDGTCDHVIICFYDKNTKLLKIFRGLKNDINRKDGNIWSLNNQIVMDVPGEIDENGFELNPVLQIWHLKNLNKIP